MLAVVQALPNCVHTSPLLEVGDSDLGEYIVAPATGCYLLAALEETPGPNLAICHSFDNYYKFQELPPYAYMRRWLMYVWVWLWVYRH